jgi:hypothetical protein
MLDDAEFEEQIDIQRKAAGAEGSAEAMPPEFTDEALALRYRDAQGPAALRRHMGTLDGSRACRLAGRCHHVGL